VVEDQCGERLAFHVFGDDEKRTGNIFAERFAADVTTSI
jgi:hypothetical protein